ncbi:MAG: hemerythrin domain-containing protein [Ignavibacteriaceae bacterium]
MKRHNVLILLSHDHHHGLLLAQLLKKSAPAYKGLPSDTLGKINYAIEKFNSELTIHFKDEEKILFPILKGKDLEVDKLIGELIEEHKKLREKIISLKDIPDPEDTMDEIGYLLESHIRKEERNLFQKAQQVLVEEELSDIELSINQSRKEFVKTCSANNNSDEKI